MNGAGLTLGAVALLALTSLKRGSMNLRPVAALYVDTIRGPYAHLPGVTAYGVENDATAYSGPGPCVLHPPCGHWGNYSAKAHDDGHTGPIAVAQVRRFSGVLEHPRRSKLWAHEGIPKPGEAPDRWGGWTMEVSQHWWGHPAEKRTWLYIVGVRPEDVPPLPPKIDPPEARMEGRVTRGVLERMAKSKRHLTPAAFAAFLVEIARKAHVGPAGSRGIFDWTPERTPAQVTREAADRVRHQEREHTREAQRQEIRRSSPLTVDQIRGVLRAARLPVTGDRVRLVHRLALLNKLRDADPETMTVQNLKDLLRPLRAGRGLTTRDRLLARVRELQGPLTPTPAKKVRTSSASILWTNPLTGRTEELTHTSASDADRLLAVTRERHRARIDAARHHLDLGDPDIRIGGSGHPLADEETLNLLAHVARLEQDAAGAALSGDLARLEAIRRDVAQLLRKVRKQRAGA